MTIALVAALVAANITWVWLLDRKDKRHDAQLTRLIVHVQAPREAVAQAMAAPADGPLYLPPEDDDAWNKQHGAAD